MKRFPVVMILLGMLFPINANAFVCTRVADQNGSETGPSLSWFWREGGRTLRFMVQKDGTDDIEGTAEFNDLRDSFLVWQNLEMEDAEGCDLGAGTDLEFYGADSSSALQEDVLTEADQAGYDYLAPDQNENLLVFRDQGWPHAGQGSLIIALTTLTYNSLTGEILDSDIEYNSERFGFTGRSDVSIETDLMNTTVHELGHFLGLGHVPDDAAATMFPKADTGETKKRTLSCDDAQGVVFKYPADAVWDSSLPHGAERNGYCDPAIAECGYCAPPEKLSRIPTVEIVTSSNGSLEDGAGCRAAPLTPVWMLLMALGVLMWNRRRVF